MAGRERSGSGVAPDWAALAASGLLEAIQGAVLGTGADGVIGYANAAAEIVYGLDRGDLVGADLVELLTTVGQHSEATALLASVLGGHPWAGELGVRTATEETLTARVTGIPLREAGHVVGVILVADTSTPEDPAAVAAHLAETRVTRLAHVTAELAGCRDTDEVTSVVIAHAADAVGASVASLSLLTAPDTLTLVGLRGGSDDPRQWATYPLAATLPTSEALRDLRTIVLTGRQEIELRYPELAGQVRDESRSMVCLPLSVHGRRFGVVTLGFTGLWAPDPKELQFLAVFADTCAQALERLGALSEAQTAAARLGLLADVSIALAQSLDYRATLTNVARLAVPTIADWCSVEILEEGVLHTLAVQHTDPAKIELAYEYQRRYPADAQSLTGSASVVRTGVSEIYPEITDEMLVASAQDEEHLRRTRELGLASVMIVPLHARGRVLGAMTFVSAESGRRYDTADLAFAENLARRAATAIDNADLFTQTQEVAMRLQRAVLPSRLPEVEGFDIAFEYHPAGRTEVGGDFYDVVALGDGRIVALVGDVAGRGVAAAAAMAQMRAAIRAYVAIDPDPTSVLSRLDILFGSLASNQLVTIVYLLIDPATDSVTIASAGHVPPILFDPQAGAVTIWAPITPPIGIDSVRGEVTVDLPPGAGLLVYTDGLVERRGEDIYESIGQLLRVVPSLADDDLADRLHQLVQVQGHVGEDDLTALAVRRSP